MVATARGRKTPGTSEHENYPNPVRTPDGRRHIFGLSQAIREKAFQSTSPSSEAKHVQSPHVSQVNSHIASYQLATQHSQKKSAELTIEERLRNLLNSDTEGTDDRKVQKVPPPTRNRSRTPGPFASSSPQKQQEMNRTGGDPHSGRLVQRLSNGDYVLVNRNQSQHASSVSPNNVRTNPLHAQPRRCTSAIPPSFHHDENWNKVPEHRPYLAAPTRVSSTRLVVNNHEPQRTTPNQSPNGHAVQSVRSPQSGGKAPIRDQQQRPAPALRRSLCFDNDNVEPQMVFNPDPNSQALSMRLTAPTYQQHMYNSPPQPQQHSTPTGHLHRHQARSYENMTQGQRHDHHGHKGGSPNANQSPVKSPHPRQEPVRRSPNFKSSSPAKPHVTGDVIASHKRSEARPHYPQQNFSFRRAVHHSVSNESVNGRNGGTKRSPQCPEKQPPGDDRDTRKSDDRDSGTVLEPEASVFDFDSSILSEEPDIPSPTRADLSPPKEAWSRSSTPLLPPLSFPEEDEVVHPKDEVVAEEDLEAKAIAEQHFVKHNPSANLRRAKSDSKVKELQSRNPPFSPTLGGAEELSPTESALSDAKAKNMEMKNQSKIVSSKLQRGASTVRRGFHPKNLSGDERSRVSKKHRQRRRFDDSDATDWSQQHESCRIADRSRHSAYYRHSSVTIDASEIGETSSVRSITTTSVCSGALRKSVRRRRSGVGGVDRYSREIRSVNKRFTRLEAHVVTLARSLAQLSSELRHQSVTSREIDQLRQQVQEIKTHQQTAAEHNRRTQPQIILKSEGKQPKLSSKLAKFFGEQPPLIHLFLKQLGYEKYIKNFECERIGMMELPYMDEKRLHDIGIPLGPRLRILKEAQKSSYV